MRKSGGLEEGVELLEIEFQIDDTNMISFLNKNIDRLMRMSHPNIIKYIDFKPDYQQSKLKYYMIIRSRIQRQQIIGDSLSNLIKRKRYKGSYFREKQIWNIFLQILVGMKYLHENDMSHQNLDVNVRIYGSVRTLWSRKTSMY